MPLLRLPLEIHLAIIAEVVAAPLEDVHGIRRSRDDAATVDRASLLSLGKSCSFYRGIVLPKIYESVTLRNTEKSGDSIQAIAQSTFSHHVKRLNFVGSAPGDNEGIAYRDTEGVMPESVYDVLGRLDQFSNLETLSVRFDFHFNVNFSSHEKWKRGFEMFSPKERYATVVKAEESQGWRALMALAWSAIIRNEVFQFKALEIHELLPREVSTYSTPEFRSLLRAMDRVYISTYGLQDDHLIRTSNTLRGVHYFYSRLDELFLDHLDGVKHFTLRAHESCHLGLGATDHHLPLPLHDYHMPALESIHLESVFVCPNLLEFFETHTDSLRDVVMRDCMGSANQDGTLDEPGVLWEQLLNTMADASPQRLRSIVVDSADGLTSHEASYGSLEDESHQDFDGNGDMGENGVLAHARLRGARYPWSIAEDDQRIKFAYKISHRKRGCLEDDGAQQARAWRNGDDLRAYNRLVRIVKSNR